MATISEDYVSFETAKLLKEKGFNVETEHEMWYVVKQFSTGCHWNSCTYKVGDITREYDEKCCIAMPTLQMAIKWLRETYKIHIVLSPNKKMNNQYCSIIFVDKEGELHPQPTDFFHGSYEEAADNAIKYSLEYLTNQ